MKILLLGANGQLGSDILRANALLKMPYEILAWQRAQCDISNLEYLKTALLQTDFDVLINCTSYHLLDTVEKNPTLAFLINADCVKVMAECCQIKNARFFHVSTDYVFGGTNQNTLLHEESTPAPLNVYGATKLMGESLATNIHAKTYIFRVASLFGLAGASGKGGNFVETMIRMGKEKGMLKVINDQIMSPTATFDIANIFLKAINKNIAPGIYHAVNTGETSWFEFAKSIIEFANIKATVQAISASEYPALAKRPSYSALTNQKLQTAIGPIAPWQDSLMQYLKAKGHIH